MSRIICGTGPMPIGVESFEKICAGGYCYVDKTLLIWDVVDSGAEATLFTRPRRFGKSLNMDMLGTFFEKTDEDTSWCFQDKEIWECGERYTDRQGKYPVVRLSFAGAAGSSWNQLRGSVIAELQNEFERQLDKMDKGALSDRNLARMNNFIDGELEEVRAERSLQDLTRILRAYYCAPAIVLIDEYDTPIERAWKSGDLDLYNRTVGFMRNMMLPALKGNRYLAFACLTGVLRVAREGLFSGLNHLKVNGVLNERYDEYFGFTPEEVRKLVAARRPDDGERTYQELASWYEGYRFGDQEVFNPWSVLNYFDEGCKAEAYWSNTSSNDALGEVLLRGDAKLYEDLRGILEGRPALAVVEENLRYPDLAWNVPGDASSAAYTLLLMSGYLTPTDAPSTGPEDACEAYEDGIKRRWLTIPNRELRAVYRREILGTMPQQFPDATCESVRIAVQAGDAGQLETGLTKQLMSGASFFDLQSEKEYQMWLLGLLAAMPGYRIRANREAGNGRYDLCLTPTVGGTPGVLIEIKVADKDTDPTEERLEELALEGIGQIRKKKYAAGLEADGVSSILELGAAFYRKTACVRSGAQADALRDRKRVKSCLLDAFDTRVMDTA